MRQRFIQHPETLELIPADEYHDTKAPSGPFVLPDIKPYQSMATGEMIGGRRQHREHLRQHGLIEIGNEKLTPKPRPAPSAKQDVIEAVRRFC